MILTDPNTPFQQDAGAQRPNVTLEPLLWLILMPRWQLLAMYNQTDLKVSDDP